MNKVKLGHSGMEVSEICLGTMTMGTGVDENTSFEILDQYLYQGGSFLDTANNYCAWAPGSTGDESERLIGRWMAARKNRSKLFIATKVGFERNGEVRGLKAKQIVKWFENSLRNMGTDVIDLYYAHVDDRNTPVEETMEAFDKLIKAGKVRSIGASNIKAWRLEEIQNKCMHYNYNQYCCVQQRHSYLQPGPYANFDPQIVANEDLLDYCTVKGLTLLAYSPLLGGSYDGTDKKISPQYICGSRLETLKRIASSKDVTNGQLVLAWMMQSKQRVIPIIGVSNIRQLLENLGALDIVLTDGELMELNKSKI